MEEVFSRVSQVKRLIAAAFMVNGITNLTTYLLPLLVCRLRKPQNLKIKYGAQWALVTGSSSGLGAAFAERFAEQGINVVLVALDDKVLAEYAPKIKAKFPKVQFRVVPVNLGKFPAQGPDDYMVAIKKATDDINVTIVVNNAGYVYLEAFHNAVLSKQLDNIECMVLSYVKITDHFYKKMIERKSRGAIFMTSSQGAFFPSPLSTVYSGAKAFVASYVHALAVEAKHHNIDVLVTHPGYMRSNFTRDLPKLKLWAQLDKIGQYPVEVVDNALRCIGRVTVLDSGAFSWGSRIITKFFDTNFLVKMLMHTATWNPDFRRVMMRPRL